MSSPRDPRPTSRREQVTSDSPRPACSSDSGENASYLSQAPTVLDLELSNVLLPLLQLKEQPLKHLAATLLARGIKMQWQAAVVFSWVGVCLAFALLVPAEHRIFGATKLVLVTVARDNGAAMHLNQVLVADSFASGALLCRFGAEEQDPSLTALPSGSDMTDLLSRTIGEDLATTLGGTQEACWYCLPTVPGPARASRVVVIVTNNQSTIETTQAMFSVGYFSVVLVVNPSQTSTVDFSSILRGLRTSGVKQVAVLFESHSQWLSFDDSSMSQRTIFNHCALYSFPLIIVGRLLPQEHAGREQATADDIVALKLATLWRSDDHQTRIVFSQSRPGDYLAALRTLALTTDGRCWREVLDEMRQFGSIVIEPTDAK